MKFRNKRKEESPKNNLKLNDRIFKDVYELTEKRVKRRGVENFKDSLWMKIRIFKDNQQAESSIQFRVALAYVIAWARGQLSNNFTSIFKVSTIIIN